MYIYTYKYWASVGIISDVRFVRLHTYMYHIQHLYINSTGGVQLAKSMGVDFKELEGKGGGGKIISDTGRGGILKINPNILVVTERSIFYELGLDAKDLNRVSNAHGDGVLDASSAGGDEEEGVVLMQSRGLCLCLCFCLWLCLCLCLCLCDYLCM